MSFPLASPQDDLAQWYGDHHAWLQGWLARRLGCVHRAADVAQDTFVRALLSGSAVHRAREPRAWLMTTARRIVIDEARRRRIEADYMAALAAAGETLAASPEQTLMAVQSLVTLDQALARVSPKAREAFLRHCFEGEARSDLARSLGVSTRMVHKYLAQVMVQLHLLTA